MTIHVTRDQVDNAKLLMALDRADGRESEEWIVRLAGASTNVGDTLGAELEPSTMAQLDARLRFLEAEVAELRAQA